VDIKLTNALRQSYLNRWSENSKIVGKDMVLY